MGDGQGRFFWIQSSALDITQIAHHYSTTSRTAVHDLYSSVTSASYALLAPERKLIVSRFPNARD